MSRSVLTVVLLVSLAALCALPQAPVAVQPACRSGAAAASVSYCSSLGSLSSVDCCVSSLRASTCFNIVATKQSKSVSQWHILWDNTHSRWPINLSSSMAYDALAWLKGKVLKDLIVNSCEKPHSSNRIIRFTSQSPLHVKIRGHGGKAQKIRVRLVHTPWLQCCASTTTVYGTYRRLGRCCHRPRDYGAVTTAGRNRAFRPA